MILLTAKGEESDRVIGLRLGADDYVVKPFSPAELVARVDAVLRRVDTRPSRSPTRSIVGEIGIDPASRRVIVRGEEVQLTQREFDVLLFLARHPGQVFSRNQLMDAVWQYSFYTDTSTVTVHIRRLRAKIEADPGPPAHIADGVGRRLPVRAMSAALERRLGGDRPRARLGAARSSRQFALVACAIVSRRCSLALVVLRAADGHLRPRGRCWWRRSSVAAALLAVAGARLFWPAASCATSRRSATGWRRSAAASATSRIETSARDELAELARAANAMIDRLRGEEAARDQSERARRDLVAAVSHDLRTPITSLRLLADAVGDDIVDGETARGYLRADAHPHRRAQRADRRPVRALAAGGRRHRLVAEQVPLGELVGETVDAMRVQAEAKGVAVLGRGCRRAGAAPAPTPRSSSGSCST